LAKKKRGVAIEKFFSFINVIMVDREGISGQTNNFNDSDSNNDIEQNKSNPLLTVQPPGSFSVASGHAKDRTLDSIDECEPAETTSLLGTRKPSVHYNSTRASEDEIAARYIFLY
jgi:hypothetical protein